GKTAHDVYPKEMADIVAARDRQLLQEGRQLYFEDHIMETPRRGALPVTIKSVPVLGPDQEPDYILVVIEDISHRKQAEHQIAHLSEHDPLTDLPNRAAFNAYLTPALGRASAASESLALVCLDLDRFKEVNDVFGHVAGDELLCGAARRL